MSQPDEAFARTWGEAFPPAFRPFAACEAESDSLWVNWLPEPGR